MIALAINWKSSFRLHIAPARNLGNSASLARRGKCCFCYQAQCILGEPTFFKIAVCCG
jgi:hypothetical protein